MKDEFGLRLGIGADELVEGDVRVGDASPDAEAGLRLCGNSLFPQNDFLSFSILLNAYIIAIIVGFVKAAHLPNFKGSVSSPSSRRGTYSSLLLSRLRRETS